MSVQLGDWKDGKLFIEGLEYTFPKKPLKKDFINYGKPKKEQIWVRSEYYKTFNWSKGWEDRLEDNPKQLQFLVDEITRIYNGTWILIEGEEVYLNGDMYMFLQWFLLEEGDYPNFRDSSLLYFRFIEICEKSKLCTGHTLLKARRLGATAMILSRMLRQLLINTDSNFGIVANKGKNSSKIFQRVVKSMGNLPVFLKPTQEGNTAPKQVLSLKEQAQRITKSNNQSESQGGLNNELSWENTDLNSYDSFALTELLLDEGGKYPKECPVNKYLPIVTKCVKKGARITGKINMPTTVNPPSSGGAEYREVWENSDQSKADYLGQTKTGLYRLFIPSYIGFDGYILPSGKSVWDTPTDEERKILQSLDGCPDHNVGAKEYLENIRKQLENNPEALQEEIRMNPFNAEEVFESSNDRCIFNIKDLNERENELIEKLIDLGRSTKDGELGRRGWFHRMADGRVRFVDDPQGLWYVHYLLDENDSNKFIIDKKGNKVPTNESFGAGGLDPVASGQATVDKGSDLCCIIRRRHFTMDEQNSGIPVAMFLGRMPDVDLMYAQIYNSLQYYGVKMLGERAPDYFVTYADKNGFSEYLYGFKRADGSVVRGIPPSAGKSTMDEHARVQVMSSLSDHYKIPFIRLIRDRKNFSIKDRTDYDACMADGYALMALEYPFKKETRNLTFDEPLLHLGRGII